MYGAHTCAYFKSVYDLASRVRQSRRGTYESARDCEERYLRWQMFETRCRGLARFLTRSLSLSLPLFLFPSLYPLFPCSYVLFFFWYSLISYNLRCLIKSITTIRVETDFWDLYKTDGYSSSLESAFITSICTCIIIRTTLLEYVSNENNLEMSSINNNENSFINIYQLSITINKAMHAEYLN